MSDKDYEPFGEEWEKEVMKWNKKHIIEQYKNRAKECSRLEQIIKELKSRDNHT